MTGRNTLGTAAAIVAVAAAGLVVWGAAVVGVAQYAEDLCFDDLDGKTGYGAFQTEAELWPPSYECHLLGNDVQPIAVSHQGVAVARLVATVLLPVTYVLVALGTASWWRSRRSVSPGLVGR